MLTRPRFRPKLRLTNACWRVKLTPAGVKVIRIRDKRGRVIECSDAKEAITVLEYLEREEQKVIRRRIPGAEGVLGAIAAMVGGTEETSFWKPDTFWKFIEALGKPQKRVLGLLVQKRRVSDDEIRKALGLDTNLELGGVLSGVSKQAASHNIPARAVFIIENEMKGGETTKTYVVALDFLRIATEMNWPD